MKHCNKSTTNTVLSLELTLSYVNITTGKRKLSFLTMSELLNFITDKYFSFNDYETIARQTNLFYKE